MDQGLTPDLRSLEETVRDTIHPPEAPDDASMLDEPHCDHCAHGLSLHMPSLLQSHCTVKWCECPTFLQIKGAAR